MCDIPYSVYPSKKIIQSGGGDIDQGSALNSIFTAQDVAGTKELKETELFFSKSGDTSLLYIYDDVNNNIPLQITATQDNVDNNNNSVSISVDNVSSSALTLVGNKVGVNKVPLSIYQLDVNGDIRGDDIHGDKLSLQNVYTQGGIVYLQTDVAKLETEMGGAGSTGGELLIKTKVPNSTITEKLRINGNGAIGIGGSNFGTAGQVLTSNGSTSSVSWTTPSAGGGGGADKLNIEVYGISGKKRQILYDTTKTITASDIVARLDAPPDKNQVYTFGETISNKWLAGGSGTNTIAYSDDGINWTGLGNIIFTICREIEWNGSLWVATGSGTNTLAYSSDGVSWTGIGNSIFQFNGRRVEWGDSLWVGVGQGTNSIAYSSDGISWTGLGTGIFSTEGRAIRYNGNIWVAGGQGTNTIAVSSDGINWTGLGNILFTACRCVVWSGKRWVAGGSGTNTLAYSEDGVNWVGLGTSIFSGTVLGVDWNGERFVAGGDGGNTLAYSTDGITWLGLGTSIFSTITRVVAWNGFTWVAGGNGTNTLAYSRDGITWTGVGTSVFSTNCQGLGYNYRRSCKLLFSPSFSTPSISIPGGTLTINSTALDIVSETYYNNGYTNLALTFK